MISQLHYRVLLTPAQIHIAQMMIAGLHQTEIARELQKTPEAIYSTIQKMRERTGARTPVEMIAKIVRDQEQAKRGAGRRRGTVTGPPRSASQPAATATQVHI